MSEILVGHEGTVSVGGRTIMHLCFTDDIVGLAALVDKLADLVNCIDSAAKNLEGKLMLEKQN